MFIQHCSPKQFIAFDHFPGCEGNNFTLHYLKKAVNQLWIRCDFLAWALI